MIEIELAKIIHASEPLNKFRKNNNKERIDMLTIEQKLNLLIYSFQNYSSNYNKELCLNYPVLWNNFIYKDWEKLILKMFPRKVKYEKGNLRDLNTGVYSDVFLLNAIIGVSPFEFIFQEPTINKKEKKNFFNYLKFYGETNFYCNERELIENIVNFYELDVIVEIVTMKEYLVASSNFKPSTNYSILLKQLQSENW
ncbi:hypothetical protein [Flavobacterium sp.]|uniref:hypothetical protein n=1 Tax=Flavobacterium sp. TaxID=239 RepID=UPI0031D4EF5C